MYFAQIYSKLANYTYTGINGGDANTIKTEYHKFVVNMSNLPESYGFLDVSQFNGNGFAPSTTGVIRQHFTGWNTGKNYTRCYFGSTWTAWVAEAAKTDLSWKTVSLSGVDTEISTTGKTINLPDEVKSAKELVVSTEVGGAVELKRVMLLIPNKMDWNGSYVCRETQIASIWIQYSGGTLTYGAFMLQGFIPYLSGIIYR